MWGREAVGCSSQAKGGAGGWERRCNGVGRERRLGRRGLARAWHAARVSATFFALCASSLRLFAHLNTLYDGGNGGDSPVGSRYLCVGASCYAAIPSRGYCTPYPAVQLSIHCATAGGALDAVYDWRPYMRSRRQKLLALAAEDDRSDITVT